MRGDINRRKLGQNTFTWNSFRKREKNQRRGETKRKPRFHLSKVKVGLTFI